MGDLIDKRIPFKSIWSAYIINNTNTLDQKRTFELTVGYIKDGIFINGNNKKYKIYDRSNYSVGEEYVGLIEPRFLYSEDTVTVFEIRTIIEEELQKVISNNGVIFRKDIWSADIIRITSTFNAVGAEGLTVGYIKDGVFTTVIGEKYPIYTRSNIAAGVEYASLIESRFPNDTEILPISQVIPIMEEELQQIKKDRGVILKGNVL